MELFLYRDYHPTGTNGELYVNGDLCCYTIELPWLENRQGVSCISEGRYPLQKRYSKKWGAHLLVTGVPNRSLILIHPANDALRELKGCIAPVCCTIGAGKGLRSRIAFQKLINLVYKTLEEAPVFLIIKTKQHEHHKPDTGTNA